MDTGDDKVSLIIKRLEECKNKIDEWEKQPVSIINNSDFKVWQEAVKKWLRMGGPATSTELKNFTSLLFFILRVRLFEQDRYDAEDHKRYKTDLALARSYIESAIENLQLGIAVYSEPQKPQQGGRGDVNVQINLTNLTVLNVFNLLQEKIAALPENTPDKKTLKPTSLVCRS